MSFDVTFATAGRLPKVRKFDKYFRADGRFARVGTKSEPQWWYENDDTGVYCGFEISEEEDVDLPNSLRDTYLRFNLNYLRPRFFATEAMPLVESLCDSLGLTPVDMQGPDGPTVANTNDLIASWERNNAWAISGTCKDSTLRRCDRDAADQMHNYMLHRTLLQDAVEREYGDVFVPSWFPVADSEKTRQGNPGGIIEPGESDTVLTATTWSSAIPFIFPAADVICVVRLADTSDDEPEAAELTWLRADDLRDRLSNHLSVWHSQIGDLAILSETAAGHVTDVFEWCLAQQSDESYVRIPRDAFVDEPIRAEN